MWVGPTCQIVKTKSWSYNVHELCYRRILLNVTRSNLKYNIKLPDSSNLSSKIPQDEHDQDGPRKKHSCWGALASASAVAILSKTKIDTSEKSEQPPELEEVKVDEGSSAAVPPSTTLPTTTQTGVIHVSGSSRTWEILKSIEYGGLVEYIASLSIVTSSASSDATTLNILVLSLANLIGGLLIHVHNIWDLKSEQPKTNNEENASVDRYYEVLGKRENFFLHACITISSFIIFGLVPPLVYAFTFYESNNKDLKLAAVAGASAICITLLSIAKAYIQRPRQVSHISQNGALLSMHWGNGFNIFLLSW
ncbi:membrane protein of ER body 2-like [Prosopis cineraria]|uniref:membrane protein of ER body 2-like n=1 Tax=Prosopis cineraria TaxID=364024 RepID=UPI00240F5FEA|nr:membrane protein of ER body 2-like [Prosopis cineraria]